MPVADVPESSARRCLATGGLSRRRGDPVQVDQWPRARASFEPDARGGHRRRRRPHRRRRRTPHDPRRRSDRPRRARPPIHARTTPRPGARRAHGPGRRRTRRPRCPRHPGARTPCGGCAGGRGRRRAVERSRRRHPEPRRHDRVGLGVDVIGLERPLRLGATGALGGPLHVPARVGTAQTAPHRHARTGQIGRGGVEVARVEISRLGVTDRRHPWKGRPVGQGRVVVDVVLRLDLDVRRPFGPALNRRARRRRG